MKKITKTLFLLILCTNFCIGQNTNKAQLQISLTAGVAVNKLVPFNFDNYATIVNKRKMTFSLGYGGVQRRAIKGDQNTEQYIFLFLSAGKQIASRNKNIFFHLHAGPAYYSTFEIDFGGGSSPREGFWALRNSATMNIRIFKSLYFETGVNGNLGQHLFYGVNGGFRLCF